MPELPEVESIRRSLCPLLEGRKILRILHFTAHCWSEDEGLALQLPLALGRLERWGKYLLLELKAGSQAESMLSPVQKKGPGTAPSSGTTVKTGLAQLAPPLCLIHLRMTGKVLHYKAEDANFPLAPYLPLPVTHGGGQTDMDPELLQHCTSAHIHWAWELDDKSWLIYQDSRRFGGLRLCARFPELKLGPDALNQLPRPAAWKELCQRHPRLQAKAFLLRQDLLAGLGNIYSDELLFRAGIHPEQALAELSSRRLEMLRQHIPGLLEEAIGLGGSSFSDYVNGLGKKGQFQLSLQVYGRRGQVCQRCGRRLKSLQVAGRSTVFCPHCQPRRYRKRRSCSAESAALPK